MRFGVRLEVEFEPSPDNGKATEVWSHRWRRRDLIGRVTWSYDHRRYSFGPNHHTCWLGREELADLAALLEDWDKRHLEAWMARAPSY